MSGEEAFIQAIRENPNDDTARLVFADWLEECGDSRSEYLRLAGGLSADLESEPEQIDRRTRLSVLGDQMSAEWELAVCRPYAVILESFEATNKIFLVKVICELTSLDLFHSVLLVGGTGSACAARRGLPKVIVQGLTHALAARVSERLRETGQGVVRLYSG